MATPLMLACQSGCKEIVRDLLNHDANVNILDCEVEIL